jgi:AcrR family transcriptional regulator
MGHAAPPADEIVTGDRRHRRREQTIHEILEQALVVMGQAGVAGLSMAAVARRMDVKPPSLYKYFASLTDLYDALVARGHAGNLRVVRDARDHAEPGLAALMACGRASARWAVEHPVLAQLLFWRPVPDYRPSDAAFGDALAVVNVLRTCLAEAAEAGELDPDTDVDQALDMMSIAHFGLISQHLANDPHGGWPGGRYARLYDIAVAAVLDCYKPKQPH